MMGVEQLARCQQLTPVGPVGTQGLRQEGEASEMSPPRDGQEADRQKEFGVLWKSGILFTSIASEIPGHNLCGFLSEQTS